MTGRGSDLECVLCGRPDLAVYFAYGAHVYRRCRSCRLIQMNPLVEPEPGDDYSGYDLERYRRFVELFRLPEYQRALTLIRRFRKEGELLDVGCGTGEFLDVARGGGFSVWGVDPSPTACGIAGERHAVTCGELEDQPLPQARFDVVTVWSVLEHAPRPSAFLRKISSLLKDDGLIALRVPAADGLLPSLAYLLYRISLGEAAGPLRVVYQLDWTYKHYYYYKPRNAVRLLRLSGFEPLAVLRESSYDIPSLAYRMDYLPEDPVPRVALKLGLAILLGLSRLTARQDELVIVARRPPAGGSGAAACG
jgi:2-polyprenyl-3-methyl-5-hydroxy-6-metoxy-1,4-benzoquinol methylase